MKKLVTEQTIKDFFVGHGKDYSFPVDENTLITPLARDKAKSLGITFEKREECGAKTECNENIDLNENKPVAETVEKPLEAVTECAEKNSDCSMTYDRQMIVEAVIKVLVERGILGKKLE